MSKLAKYKATVAARTRRERAEGGRRMERAATKGGQVVGLVAAPHLTMGVKLGPIPLAAIIGLPAALLDIALAPEHPLIVFALGLAEGLGMAEIPSASAALAP